MIYNGKEIEFPAVIHTSFFKVIESLEKQAKGPESDATNLVKQLLKEVHKYPELSSGIGNSADISKYKHTIDKLSDLLFPEVLTDNEIKILTPPFFFQPIRTSRRFEAIIKSSGKAFDYTMKGVDEDIFYLYCCYFIMGSYYGFPIHSSNYQHIEIFDKKLGLNKIYKLLINADLCEFIPTKDAKEIIQQDYEELLNDFWNIDLWKKKFPPNSWIMKGVTIVNLVDVTADQSFNSIAANLLVKDGDTLLKIQQEMRNLLQDATLSLGVMTLSNQTFINMQEDVVTGLLIGEGETFEVHRDLCTHAYNQLFGKKESLVISDVEVFHQQSQSGLSQKLLESNFKSYIITPLFNGNEIQGFIELGAANTYKLHKGTLGLLGEILPVIAMAHKRYIDECQNRVEAIIQQECTTIHQSVKWRFEEEALKFIQKEVNGEMPVFKDIVFKNLYPLYGQLDIKGSSERRNKAVSADLVKQINGVKKVFKQALEQKKMPVFEQLLFRMNEFRTELSNDFSAGSEHKLLSFFEKEVYPVFEHLALLEPSLKKEIDHYYALLDPEFRSIYEKRKEYDQMVNRINQRLANYLDQKQLDAQAIFPHFFERYKTDGVEFSMYIGQSLTKDHTFNEIYLKNLRIWQIAIMCEMENEFGKIQKEFNSSIEIASLILVYNTSLAVHFRMDEKQFDVEGAYNARYEIIKKRVDKAKIKDSTERITRPGSISIVYSQEQDALEYRRYLQFLAFKGYLMEEVEDLELEDLQGVHGLRALRVEIAPTETISIDKLMEEISGGSDE